MWSPSVPKDISSHASSLRPLSPSNAINNNLSFKNTKQTRAAYPVITFIGFWKKQSKLSSQHGQGLYRQLTRSRWTEQAEKAFLLPPQQSHQHPTAQQHVLSAAPQPSSYCLFWTVKRNLQSLRFASWYRYWSGNRQGAAWSDLWVPPITTRVTTACQPCRSRLDGPTWLKETIRWIDRILVI